jgi:hypothetical protein
MTQGMVERILTRLPGTPLNAIVRAKGILLGRVPLMHHGLQRSGTNYVNACLRRIGATPINAFDPRRASPRHKHFRWQPDKRSIPPFLRSQYGNRMVAEDLAALERIARLPSGCRHLVVRREEIAWLASICSWGLACGWFASHADAIAAIPLLREDRRCYDVFWDAIAGASPASVAIVDADAVRRDLSRLPDALAKLAVPVRVPPAFRGEIDSVPHSPSGRDRRVSRDDVLEAMGRG